MCGSEAGFAGRERVKAAKQRFRDRGVPAAIRSDDRAVKVYTMPALRTVRRG